jgi:hypothetical protein
MHDQQNIKSEHIIALGFDLLQITGKMGYALHITQQSV